MSESHLGNLLYSDNGEKAINEAINMMYFRLNSLLSKFNFANISTKYHLFKTYCMTKNGGQLWDYNGKHIEKLYTARRKCCRRLLGLPPRTYSCLITEICGDNNVDDQLHRRVCKFINSALKVR